MVVAWKLEIQIVKILLFTHTYGRILPLSASLRSNTMSLIITMRVIFIGCFLRTDRILHPIFAAPLCCLPFPIMIAGTCELVVHHHVMSWKFRITKDLQSLLIAYQIIYVLTAGANLAGSDQESVNGGAVGNVGVH